MHKVGHLDGLEKILEVKCIDKKDVILTGSNILPQLDIRPNHNLDVVVRPGIVLSLFDWALQIKICFAVIDTELLTGEMLSR